VDAAREDLLERLFEQALTLPLEHRAAFLEERCGVDSDLRATLRALLAHADDAYAFVAGVAGPVVARAAGDLVTDPRDVAERESDQLLDRHVAHFRISERLGRGGMGVVYKALDIRLDRTVALKFLPAHLTADEGAKRRFIREAKAASALDHPNICAIHEIGETDAGRLFIAMAYYEGETLKQRIARGALPIREALDYVAQVAEGLQRAHEVGIVHRDIKPANVIISPAGQVRVVDFGLAKIAGTDATHEDTTIGTVAYMSPEQTRGDAVDARTDLWGVGVVLYEMLAGRRPFRGEGDASLVHNIRHDEPAALPELRPDMPAGLDAVVRRCLEKNPADRYQQAGELLADVRAIREGRGSPRRRLRPNDAWRYASVVAALLVLVLLWRALATGSNGRVDSLAVLPVRDVTGDASQQDFAEGMTDLLINQLSQLSGLRRVISRASVVEYEGTRKSSRQIARELGVDALVEASVLRAGERIRIDVRLIQADEQRVVWSHSFERAMRDVLTLQREVSQAIAHELQVRLTPQERERFVRRAREVNPNALTLYLQSARVASERERMAFLEEAIAKDSGFALAHAKVALSYIMVSRDKDKAERAIARALALDPSLSDAYDALGLLRMWLDRDWPAAERAFRRAIELNPHNARAHHELGQLAMRLGRCDEAVAQARLAMLQSPGVAHYQKGLGEVFLYCRRYDDAIREFEKTLVIVQDSGNTFWQLGDTYYHQRQYRKALAMYTRTPWPPPSWVHVALGDTAPALREIDALKAESARGEANVYTSWNLARLYTSLGDRAQAITWLERSYEERYSMVVYLKADPLFDPLRGEPRFQALLRKVGLAG
jgi:eukaryotic-like serine/threonine-protein kinase